VRVPSAQVVFRPLERRSVVAIAVLVALATAAAVATIAIAGMGAKPPAPAAPTQDQTLSAGEWNPADAATDTATGGDLADQDTATLSSDLTDQLGQAPAQAPARAPAERPAAQRPPARAPAAPAEALLADPVDSAGAQPLLAAAPAAASAEVVPLDPAEAAAVVAQATGALLGHPAQQAQGRQTARRDQAPAAPVQVAAAPQGQVAGGGAPGYGLDTVRVCPDVLPGQPAVWPAGCGPLPGPITCPDVWRADLPGSGCQPRTPPAPAQTPVCPSGWPTAPGQVATGCLPGPQWPPTCQIWQAGCDPLVPTCSGICIQSDTGQQVQGSQGSQPDQGIQASQPDQGASIGALTTGGWPDASSWSTGATQDAGFGF
jgi:hypothetical protein